MASIQREFLIEAHPDEVWSAMRDFGAVDRRLAPGFVIEARLDGDARIVTFHNGTIAREPLVDCDDERRRLVYSLISERVRHYNASVQVFPDGELRTRVSWIVDVLPHDVAPYIASQMDLAVLAMKKALASTRAPQSAM
jgi:carbon monoxide dehydrogenase subunit G